jgi:hypothetical protein
MAAKRSSGICLMKALWTWSGRCSEHDCGRGLLLSWFVTQMRCSSVTRLVNPLVRWVDLVSAYSNRPELLRPLRDVLRRIERARAEPQAAYKRETGTPTPSRRRRLAPHDIESLIDLFLAGTRQTDLAAKFGISVSGVKWVLRQRSVRRGDSTTRTTQGQ